MKLIKQFCDGCLRSRKHERESSSDIEILENRADAAAHRHVALTRGANYDDTRASGFVKDCRTAYATASSDLRLCERVNSNLKQYL